MRGKLPLSRRSDRAASNGEVQLKTLNRILTVAVLGLLGVTAVLALIGLVLPGSAHVERSTLVDAPQETIFTLVNSFDRFHQWSPWHAIDPDARYNRVGPAAGVGAAIAWVSDHPSLGSGGECITASTPHSTVISTLDFGGAGSATSTFTLEAVSNGTRVTWSLDTDFGRNIVARYFGLGFDRMLGPTLELGLDSLEEVAEGSRHSVQSERETGT